MHFHTDLHVHTLLILHQSPESILFPIPLPSFSILVPSVTSIIFNLRILFVLFHLLVFLVLYILQNNNHLVSLTF